MPLPLQRVATRSAQRGYTLIELMVTLAILGVVASLAAPGFSSIINNNRLAALSNDVMAMLQSARMEAMRRGVRVIVCPSNDGAACTTGARWNGWVVFADANGDGAPAAAELVRVEPVAEPLQLWVSNSLSADSRIVFRHDGFAYDDDGDLLAANLTACMTTEQPAENVRNVSIVTGARISVDRADTDGVCEAPANP